MSGAQPIGELFARVVTRAQTFMGFQTMLRACPDEVRRKNLIMAAYEAGALEACDAELLIQALMLETA